MLWLNVSERLSNSHATRLRQRRTKRSSAKHTNRNPQAKSKTSTALSSQVLRRVLTGEYSPFWWSISCQSCYASLRYSHRRLPVQHDMFGSWKVFTDLYDAKQRCKER